MGGERWTVAPSWQATRVAPPSPAVPATARASIVARFAAGLIDGLIGWALSLPGVFLAGVAGPLVGGVVGLVAGLLGVLAAMAVPLVYAIAMLAGPHGQTVGKWVMGVRVVREDGGGSLSVATAAGRVLAAGFLSQVLLLGYIWALFEPRRRTWHDLLAGTVVVQAAPGTKPSFADLLARA